MLHRRPGTDRYKSPKAESGWDGTVGVITVSCPYYEHDRSSIRI